MCYISFFLIFFNLLWKWNWLSHVWLFVTSWTVHGILQARILEWVAVPLSRRFSQPRNQARVSCIKGGFFTSWYQGSPLYNTWKVRAGLTKKALSEQERRQRKKERSRNLNCYEDNSIVKHTISIWQPFLLVFFCLWRNSVFYFFTILNLTPQRVKRNKLSVPWWISFHRANSVPWPMSVVLGLQFS